MRGCAVNKYELALRLDKARARGWAVDYALGGNPIAGVLYAAEHSLETAEKAAAQWRADVEIICAVLAEIEAEEKPAEPEVSIDSDAPCANPDGCEGENAHENFMRAHNPEKCDGARPWCHPYRAPEPSYDGPRYASGEQPMVGDIAVERKWWVVSHSGRSRGQGTSRP